MKMLVAKSLPLLVFKFTCLIYSRFSRLVSLFSSFCIIFFNLLVTYFVVTSIISPQFACYFHLCFVLNFDGQRYFVVFSFYSLLASFFGYLFGRTFLTLHFNIKIFLRFLLGVFYLGPTA